jgi:hypothetical protein
MYSALDAAQLHHILIKVATRLFVNSGGACTPLTGPLTVTQYGGTITSPNYPLNYYNNADCSWLLQPSNAAREVGEKYEVDTKICYFIP